jgi:hypothetical protein
MVSDNNNSKELENYDINLCSNLNKSKRLKILYCTRYENKSDIQKDMDILCLYSLIEYILREVFLE